VSGNARAPGVVKRLHLQLYLLSMPVQSLR